MIVIISAKSQRLTSSIHATGVRRSSWCWPWARAGRHGHPGYGHHVAHAQPGGCDLHALEFAALLSAQWERALAAQRHHRVQLQVVWFHPGGRLVPAYTYIIYTSTKPVPALSVNILVSSLGGRCSIKGLWLAFREVLSVFIGCQKIRARFARSRPIIFKRP